MRTIAVIPAIILGALATPGIAVAQVQELPNVPVVSGGWQGPVLGPPGRHEVPADRNS